MKTLSFETRVGICERVITSNGISRQFEVILRGWAYRNREYLWLRGRMTDVENDNDISVRLSKRRDCKYINGNLCGTAL